MWGPHRHGGFNDYRPSDVLRGGFVARLEERLNGLRPFVQPRVCPLVGGVGFGVVLAYADGSVVRLEGYTGGGDCASIEVEGAEAWADPTQVLDLALALIREQRGNTAPAKSVEPPSCPSDWQSVGGTAGARPVAANDLVAVTACRYALELDPRFITQSADGTLREEVRVADTGAILRGVVAARWQIRATATTTTSTASRTSSWCGTAGETSTSSRLPTASPTSYRASSLQRRGLQGSGRRAF